MSGGTGRMRGRRGVTSRIIGAGAISMLIAAAAATITIPAGEVIAAQSASDQPAPAAISQSSPDQAATAPSTRPTSFGSFDVMIMALAGASLALIILTRWYRLGGRRAPSRPQAFTPMSGLLLLGAMYLMGYLGWAAAHWLGRVNVPANPDDMPLNDAVKLTFGVLAARFLGVGGYIALQRQARIPQPDQRASIPGAIVIGVVALLLAWPLVQTSIDLAGWLVNAPPEKIAHQTLRQLAHGKVDVWMMAMIALVTIAAPIIEEVMYRGLLQEGLRRAGLTPWPAIALTSMVFALAHVGIVQQHALVGLFVLAMGLGWAYEKAGRLWAPITMHALFNAANLILARNA